MAKRIVAGNWKMNLGPRDGRRFIERLEVPDDGRDGVDILLFPPSLTFTEVARALEAAEIPALRLGLQNVFHEDSGAFTGEISAAMAAEAGADYALVGHSERRHLFGETDEETRLKVEAALRHGLVPMLCVGETLDERRAGRVEDVVLRQLDAVVEADPVRKALLDGQAFAVAYEPVWAIGTGETATPSDASRAHGVLRSRIRERFGDETASRVPLLYGGSVKPENASELLGAAEVDGVLVGGASLDPGSFADIVRAAG